MIDWGVYGRMYSEVAQDLRIVELAVGLAERALITAWLRLLEMMGSFGITRGILGLEARGIYMEE